jgi:hypothetical protein
MQRIQRGIILIFSMLPFLLWGQDDGGRSGFDFLKNDMGARPAAMGGAFIAIIGDIHGITYNPASLMGTPDKAVTFTYLDHLLDIKSGFVGFHKSLGKYGHLGIGVLHTNYGDFQKTDVEGNTLGDFSAVDYMISTTYANKLPYGLRLGISIKYIHSKYDVYSAGAVAGDLGLLYRIESQNFNIGLTVSNLGTATKAFIDVREKLPLTYRLGFSKQLAYLPLLLNFNLIKYHHQDSKIFWGLYWALGGEFTVSDHFFLRWGYNSRGSEEKVGADSDRFAGLSLGLGIHYKQYRFDYAFTTFGAMGGMHFLTVGMAF